MTKRLLMFSALLIGLNLCAQENLQSDTFKVVKEYKPTLIDANKIQFQPEIDDEPKKLDAELSYDFIEKKVSIDYEPEKISPARIKGEPLVKLYNGYAKLGVGNVFLPFGEVYYNNLRSKKYAAGTHLKYLNSREVNSIKDSDRSQLLAEVFGTRFWKTNTLDANLKYERDDVNYYGYHQVFDVPSLSSPLASSALGQVYNRLSSKWHLKTTKQDSFNLRHEVSLNYAFVQNDFDVAENNIKLEGTLSQIVNQELYALDLILDYNKFDNIFENTILALNPKISTIGESFKVTAGLGIYMNADQDADFHFYPMAEVKFNVIEDYLVSYAGVRGQIRRNSFNRISRENPFIAPAITLTNTNEKYDIYGGVRGTLSKYTSFNLNLNHREIENEYFFVKVNDIILNQDFRFDLTFDDLTETTINGELAYRKDKKINVYLNGQYAMFDTERELEAWHRPEIEVNLGGEYNLQQKIITRLEVFYWSEQFAKSVRSTANGNEIYAEKLDAIIDLNLGFEYRYTKRLSAFVDFNNLLGVRYEKYQDYPTVGFNVFGGLTYSF